MSLHASVPNKVILLIMAVLVLVTMSAGGCCQYKTDYVCESTTCNRTEMWNVKKMIQEHEMNQHSCPPDLETKQCCMKYCRWRHENIDVSPASLTLTERTNRNYFQIISGGPVKAYSDNRLVAKVINAPGEYSHTIGIVGAGKGDAVITLVNRYGIARVVNVHVDRAALTIFVDGKELDNGIPLRIARGEFREIVVVTRDLITDLEIVQKNTNVMIIDSEKIDDNRCKISVTGKDSGEDTITFRTKSGNEEGRELRVHVIVPLRVLEMSGETPDKYRPFTVTRCREEVVVIESDRKPEIVNESEVETHIDIINRFRERENRKNTWELVIKAKANKCITMPENQIITFINEREEKDTIHIKIR